jgi:hypothetical protein
LPNRANGIRPYNPCFAVGANGIRPPDGKHLKSMNKWYNKQVAMLKEGKPQGFWSDRLAQITEKRNRQFRDAIRGCLKSRTGYNSIRFS